MPAVSDWEPVEASSEWEAVTPSSDWESVATPAQSSQLDFSKVKTPMQFLPGGMNEPATKEQRLAEVPAIIGSVISAPGAAIDAVLPKPVSEFLFKPLVNPQTSPEDIAFRKAHPIIGGTEAAVVDLAKSFTSPVGIATLGMGALPQAAQKAVSLTFAAQMASSMPELTGQIIDTWNEPDSPDKRLRLTHLLSTAAGTTLFTGLATKHGLSPRTMTPGEAAANRAAVEASIPPRIVITPEAQFELAKLAPKTAEAVSTTIGVPNAIPVESANAEVLRHQEPQVGLPQVGTRNAEPEIPTTTQTEAALQEAQDAVQQDVQSKVASTEPIKTLSDYDPEDIGQRARLNKKKSEGLSHDQAVQQLESEHRAVEQAVDSLPEGTQVRNKQGQLYELFADGWYEVKPNGDLNFGSASTSQNLRGGKVERLGKPKPKEAQAQVQRNDVSPGNEVTAPATTPWWREEMLRRGMDPNRTFNDVDLSNPSIREAIGLDPTLTEPQKQQLLETGSLKPKSPIPAMDRARREWIDRERKTNPRFAPDIESWKELLTPKELAEVREWEDLKYKSVARQGPETGYKPFKLSAAQKARFRELTEKYLPRQQAEIGESVKPPPENQAKYGQTEGGGAGKVGGVQNPASEIIPSGFVDFDILEEPRLGLTDPPPNIETIPSGPLPEGTIYKSVGKGFNGNRPATYAFTPDGKVYDDSGRTMTHGGSSPWVLRYVTKWFNEPTKPTPPATSAGVNEPAQPISKEAVALRDEINKLLSLDRQKLSISENSERLQKVRELSQALFELDFGLRVGQKVILKNGESGKLEYGRPVIGSDIALVTVDNSNMPIEAIDLEASRALKNVESLPPTAPYGKVFEVVWADGRGVQYFDNLKAAEDFAAQPDREPSPIRIIDKPRGARVKSEAPKPDTKPTPPATSAGVETKQPWQMTLDEFAKRELEIYTRSIERGEPYSHISNLDFKKNLPRARAELKNTPIEKQIEAFKNNWKEYHRSQVKVALENGKPVPPEVIAEYPDLRQPSTQTQGPGTAEGALKTADTSAQNKTPPSPVNWDALNEDLADNLDSFSPARSTGKVNYELRDMAQRFVDYAKADQSGLPLLDLVKDFAKQDEATTGQIKKLRAALKDVAPKYEVTKPPGGGLSTRTAEETPFQKQTRLRELQRKVDAGTLPESERAEFEQRHAESQALSKAAAEKMRQELEAAGKPAEPPPSPAGAGEKGSESKGLIASTEPVERADVDNGTRQTEYRVRKVTDAERNARWETYGNTPWVVERRTVRTKDGKVEHGEHEEWYPFARGDSKRSAIEDGIADTGFRSANSLDPVHKEVVTRVNAERAWKDDHAKRLKEATNEARYAEEALLRVKDEANKKYRTALKRAGLAEAAEAGKADQQKVDAIQAKLKEKWVPEFETAKSKLAERLAKIKEIEAEKMPKFSGKPEQPTPPPSEPPSGGPGEAKIQGMGGAIPEEFEQPGSYVSNMFAAIDRDRAAMGKPPMPDTKRRTWDEDNQKALALMNRDPEWIPKLITEVAANPRPLLSWENAGMVWHRAKLKAEYDNALSRIALAFDDGRTADLQSAKSDAAHFEDQLMALDAAVGRNGTGSEAGRTLNAQKMGAGDDFSLVEMRLQMRRANNGAPLTERQNAEIAQLAKEHAEKLAAFQKILEQKDARISELEAARAINEIKVDVKREPAYAPQIVEHAKRMVESLRTDRTAAMARLKARFGDKFTGMGGATPGEFEGPGGLKLTAQDVADLSMIGASEMAEFPNRAEWNARMSTALGKWVEPHLDAIWQNSNAHLDAKIAQVEKRLGKPVGEKVGRAVRKADVTERIADTKQKVKEKIASKKTAGISSDAQKLARLFVEQGITEREALIDAVHDVLSEGNPEWTRRETMDAISGYGDFKQLTKDEISVTLRDLKGQMQQLGKLEDMAAGQAPSKTGIERRSPSDVERALIKQVNEAKKRGGFTVTDPATQLASALTARKTYYRNRLADLRQEISTRERIVKTKAPTPTDPELEAMKGEYAILKREHDEIFGNRELTDEQKLKMALAAVKRDIAEYERKIAAGEFTKKPSIGVTETPELKVARAQRDALREQFNELRDLDQAFQAEQHLKDISNQKAQLEKTISEQERKLREGDIQPKSQPINRPADPALEPLKQRRDELNRQLAEARKKPETQRYAEQLAKQLERMNKAIAEKEARIAARDVAPKGRTQNRPLSTPELESARQRLDELNRQIAEIRNPKKTPEERALQAYKTRTANRIAELEDRLSKGDFAKRPRKEGPVMDEEAMNAKAALLRVEQRFLDAKRNAELKARTPFKKTLDFMAYLRREFVLSSPTSIAKLTAAASEGIAFEALAKEPVGGIIGKVFPRFAERTEVERPSSVKIEAKSLRDAFMRTMDDAAQTLKTGKSDLEVAYGGRRPVPEEMISYFGRMHAALKTPLKRAAFSRVYSKLTELYIRDGKDPSNLLTQMEIGTRAMAEANRMLFLEDNALVNAMRRGISALEQPLKSTGEPSTAGMVGATAAKIALPIVRIPTNLVARTVQAAVGFPIGSAKLAWAYAKGIESLPPAKADLIMRQLKSGSIGGAFLMAGFLAPQIFGGYYQPRQKQQPGEPKFGTIKIGDYNVPSFLLHHPLLEVMQLGATIRRVADSRTSAKDATPKGLGSGVLAGAKGLVEEVPIGREAMALGRGSENLEQYLDNWMASVLEPQLLQWLARQMDKPTPFNPLDDTTKRKPKGLMQTIEMGIPGLRQNVPTSQTGIQPTKP